MLNYNADNLLAPKLHWVHRASGHTDKYCRDWSGIKSKDKHHHRVPCWTFLSLQLFCRYFKMFSLSTMQCSTGSIPEYKAPMLAFVGLHNFPAGSLVQVQI